jgi:hypothetical protein
MKLIAQTRRNEISRDGQECPEAENRVGGEICCSASDFYNNERRLTRLNGVGNNRAWQRRALPPDTEIAML